MSSYLSADCQDWFCESCAPSDAGRWPCPDETDSPVHCADCGCYLAHPLTSHGVQYVLEQAESECRRPIGERERIMPLRGTAEDTLTWYHGSPHKAIVLDWLDHVADYGLDSKDSARLEAMRRLLNKSVALA